MIQGTGSDVGKSLIVAGLARAFARRGLRVRPFKPQNMSNNAAVTADGGEIGRAQALQARACGVPSSIHMNPVLLKPQAGGLSQVIVQGRVFGVAGGLDYQALKPRLLDSVLSSWQTLGQDADLMLVEGAGSPAEVNLRAGDIANMGFAEAADLPVILVGDIDRGGVIASLVGTHLLLTEAERARIKGYLINKFRGDTTLFHPAVDIIRAHTGFDCLGILPWFDAAAVLPEEDSMALDRRRQDFASSEALRIVVPRLPHIANFDDLDPLAADPNVSVSFVSPGSPLPGDADLILLPGSKATIADLAALREEGWDIDLLAHHRRGGGILGICGGYQMLGRSIDDPEGLEGPPGKVAGLGLLAVDTVMRPKKQLALTRATVMGVPVSGYEIHMGETSGPDAARPYFDQGGGARSADGLVSGCYLHGLFIEDTYRAAFLSALRPGFRGADGYEARIEAALDHLADHLAAHVDLDRLFAIAGGQA